MAPSILSFQEKKAAAEKITVLTAYDAAMARLLHQADVDMLLVGDSLGMVVLGYDSTVPVTMEQMLHHCAAVRRGAPEAFVVGDMPFGSYQCDSSEAVRNAIRLVKEAGCDAVKLEGGTEVVAVVQRIVTAGVPVMGHIGLTPQTASQLGGYKVQGRDLPGARKMLADARALQKSGVFAMVLECVPSELAALITEQVAVPTIGIGAGTECDGQVLVISDLLGMYEKFVPRFVKQYAHLAPQMLAAVQQYVGEVRQGKFPSTDQSFTSPVDYHQLLLSDEG